MKKFNLVYRAVESKKRQLKKTALKKGIYENFGENEIGRLKDKFNFFQLVYGTEDDRLAARVISDFENWCMNFDLSQI